MSLFLSDESMANKSQLIKIYLFLVRGISQVLNEAHHYFKNLKPTWKILCTKQAIQDNIYLPDAFQQQLTDTPVHSYTHIALTITIPASAIKSDQCVGISVYELVVY
ncbi:nucleolar MIF4G domain-containing protein 1 [Trichinella spiralis]|uniref:nucleolar MIF4G domain-containing protein 1 n=1 Tax=Trichinella spiralis TaxID=6334 RepID=UPI0001EFBE81|nr:nucleolar MIF4G domain-containing protein 1 [Trichinella spiralis]